MPTGPGGLDANGIWQYGEDDTEALASDLLNLGMGSVSTVVAGLGAPTILQVLSTTKTDTYTESMTGGAFSTIVPGLTATITPSATSSKILVMLNVTGSSTSSFGAAGGRLVRDGSPIAVGDADGSRSQITMYSRNTYASTNVTLNASTEFLDSPATTSAVTYGFQMWNGGTGTFVYKLNKGNGTVNYVYAPRAVSSITLMEVAG